MNKKLSLLIATTFLNCFLLHAQKSKKQNIAFAEQQTKVMLQSVNEAKANSKNTNAVVPRSIKEDGSLALISSRDWCSGFFPGELWYLYERTHNSQWLSEARKYTALIEQEQFDKGTHDLGFKIYCSVGNAYRLTHDPHYKDVIITAAKTLSQRFNPQVGCIKSWDNRKEWQFPVIIDNMMNLELLFAATRLSGDSSFYKIAVTHANTTLKNHFRADNSSYHVIDYDPQSGQVLHKQTHQGYADESAWARGQAWGLYGYTMCYRETKNPVYLQQAERIATFILNNPTLPADKVPYWDFNAPNIPNAPRDASAAAIMASAFYELSHYSKSGKLYKATANKIMSSLSTAYQVKPGGSKGFILLHSTGHLPAKSEIDVPIIYADYYYLEALLRQ
ncbi:glycoside hydrolase family 88 protein [Mucilaginibacter sp. Bleaf8]|uniref:glycoside hydrolase family 88 protein n=1 Tax=Mucilaginibacter sp. Bleaf8 TaxID=2834430 RepID=UPI001BCC28E9|nr:glycoside hydrolase family 88 protein [Mucilaginibacter sp. Bleaf8]MBS7564827.1 glycoside hydrolase family 88 protein [Mucilaginibacter sp. Bleaf8]